MNESVCLSQLAEVKYTKHREKKKKPSEEENVVEEVEKKGVRARKFFQCVYLVSGVRVPSSTATEKRGEKGAGGHPPEQRQREKAKVPR